MIYFKIHYYYYLFYFAMYVWDEVTDPSYGEGGWHAEEASEHIDDQYNNDGTNANKTVKPVWAENKLTIIGDDSVSTMINRCP